MFWEINIGLVYTKINEVFFLWIIVELTHLKYKSRQLKHKRGNLVNLTFSELKVLCIAPDYADTRVQFG